MTQQTPDNQDDFVQIEPMEIEEPRRAASARFEIDEEVGTQAAMREAMDPANQSLGDALRLSYRILQLAILGLVVTFLFSGFQTIKEGYSGVRTVFGAISGGPGEEQLSPGLEPFWPYPVGEVIVFRTTQAITLNKEFWPSLGHNASLEEATGKALITKHLEPGKDGLLITAGGDMAHIQLSAEYTIADAVNFLENVDLKRSEKIVKLALKQAAVHVISGLTLSELLELTDQPVEMVHEQAQSMLDEIDCGIKITNLEFTNRAAPLAIRRVFRDVQTAREDAKTVVEMARQEANSSLAQIAGTAYGDLMKLINEYELAASRGDDEKAEEQLQQIGKLFESDAVGGEASRIINRALAYQSEINATLGKEVQRLQGLMPAYRENPDQLIRQLSLSAYQSVLAQDTVEVFSLPMGIGALDLAILSSPEIMQVRRDAAVQMKKLQSQQQGLLSQPWTLGSSQLMLNKAGRLLERDATGGQGRQ